MQIRDRIKELRRVKASELHPSPHNWRVHGKSQVDALRGSLKEIGFADANLARERPDGTLESIDGHCRAELAGDAEIPVLVLDVNEDEAKKLLLTLDPLAAMAETDKEALGLLIQEVQTEDDGLAVMLDELAMDAGIKSDNVNDPNAEWQGMPGFEHEDQTTNAAFIIRVFFKDAEELAAFGRLIGKDLTGRKFTWFSKQPRSDTVEVVDE
jgi:hypothetical protein